MSLNWGSGWGLSGNLGLLVIFFHNAFSPVSLLFELKLLSLLKVDCEEARKFYEVEAINNGWLAYQLERYINILLFGHMVCHIIKL